MIISTLPNIGDHGQEALKKVGITTPEGLVSLGAEEAWLRMKANDPGVCLHQLYALEGAILGVPKKNLSKERKAELRAFFKAEK